MFRYTVPILLLILMTACGTKKQVAARHANGDPEVVVYIKGIGDENIKVMEKVYYENGELEYVGRFQNGVEHGEWIYYYEDGAKKFVEHWENGKEQGIFYDYLPNGQIYRELHYEKGKLIETIDKSEMP